MWVLLGTISTLRYVILKVGRGFKVLISSWQILQVFVTLIFLLTVKFMLQKKIIYVLFLITNLTPAKAALGRVWKFENFKVKSKIIFSAYNSTRSNFSFNYLVKTSNYIFRASYLLRFLAYFSWSSGFIEVDSLPGYSIAATLFR